MHKCENSACLYEFYDVMSEFRGAGHSGSVEEIRFFPQSGLLDSVESFPKVVVKLFLFYRDSLTVFRFGRFFLRLHCFIFRWRK